MPQFERCYIATTARLGSSTIKEGPITIVRQGLRQSHTRSVIISAGRAAAMRAGAPLAAAESR